MKNRARERFDGDIGCFVTGRTSLGLEIAHIVNVVREKKDQTRKAEVVSVTLYCTKYRS